MTIPAPAASRFAARHSRKCSSDRLPGEPAAGVPDIVYTPGNPRTVLGGLAVRF